VFDAKLEHASVRVYSIDAQGKRTEIGSATLEKSEQIWERLPGDLLALGEKTLDKAVHGEIDLKKDFSIGEYLNVGVKVGAQLMKDGERTPDTQEGDRLFRAAGKGEPVWIRTTVEGGPTVSWSHGITI